MRYSRRVTPISGMRRRSLELTVVAWSAVLMFSLAPWKSASAQETEGSCVECHGKVSFLVTNKKLEL